MPSASRSAPAPSSPRTRPGPMSRRPFAPLKPRRHPGPGAILAHADPGAGRPDPALGLPQRQGPEAQGAGPFFRDFAGRTPSRSELLAVGASVPRRPTASGCTPTASSRWWWTPTPAVSSSAWPGARRDFLRGDEGFCVDACPRTWWSTRSSTPWWSSTPSGSRPARPTTGDARWTDPIPPHHARLPYPFRSVRILLRRGQFLGGHSVLATSRALSSMRFAICPVIT